jgi:hypothetical protein
VREFLAEVVRVAAAVVRGMQQAVNVVEEKCFSRAVAIEIILVVRSL